MKRDIDTLLAERRLSAAVIVKGEHPNPTFRYAVGPSAQHLTVGFLVLRPGSKPHLLHGGMERDAAAKTPFERSEYGDWGYAKIREREASPVGATARLLQTLLQHLSVTGDVLFARKSGPAVQPHPDTQERVAVAVAFVPGGDEIDVFQPGEVVLRGAWRAVKLL